MISYVLKQSPQNSKAPIHSTENVSGASLLIFFALRILFTSTYPMNTHGSQLQGLLTFALLELVEVCRVLVVQSEKGTELVPVSIMFK